MKDDPRLTGMRRPSVRKPPGGGSVSLPGLGRLALRNPAKRLRGPADDCSASPRAGGDFVVLEPKIGGHDWSRPPALATLQQATPKEGITSAVERDKMPPKPPGRQAFGVCPTVSGKLSREPWRGRVHRVQSREAAITGRPRTTAASKHPWPATCLPD